MTKIKSSSVVNDSKNNLVLYTDKHGDIELRADLKKDTLWATQVQIAQLFDVNPQAIVKHFKNIYRSGELVKNRTSSKMELVQSEGGRSIKRIAEFYNLDAIIAVGYRVNSKKATKFRIWATKVLHQYLVKGFNVNERTVSCSSDNVEDLQKALAFMGSPNLPGVVKGKMVLKVSKEMKE